LLFNNLPVARAVSAAGPIECDRPGGGLVTLDGTSSTDPDSSPGTQDDIARFDWILDAGEPSESPLGSGEVLDAAVPLGAHTVTLRVTDTSGESASTSIPVSVVDTTPSLVSCPAAETLECTSPAGAPAAIRATASDVCDSGVVIRNSWNSSGADASGVYPLGRSAVTFTASDRSGNSATCETGITVLDTQPPLLTVTGSSTRLWPPNHRLVPITVSWQVTDLCTPLPTARLTSATSNEPDDAPGDGDGITTGDISGADLGTSDTEVWVRAERAATGTGRTYELKYESADAAGNVSSGTVLVQVPHDTAPGADPMQLHLEVGGTAASAWIFWDPVPGATSYDLILGNLADVKSKPNLLSLGPVTVLAAGTEAADYLESPEAPGPAVDQTWFFLMQYRQADGTTSGYGRVFAVLPREPNSCGVACP